MWKHSLNAVCATAVWYFVHKAPPPHGCIPRNTRRCGRCRPARQSCNLSAAQSPPSPEPRRYSVVPVRSAPGLVRCSGSRQAAALPEVPYHHSPPSTSATRSSPWRWSRASAAAPRWDWRRLPSSSESYSRLVDDTTLIHHQVCSHARSPERLDRSSRNKRGAGRKTERVPAERGSRVNCPCPEQGRNPNNQLSSAISAPTLLIEPQDHNQPIHRNPVNSLVMIFRFCW